ncbi:MAG: LptF/LptG family permease [Saprospiraceae bacterium]|nr:LptF/LptG family permease [Saprospiraceae bacterium]
MLKIKKLDRLLIANFVGPFVVTFMIAIFVLLMQILWLYIDDIAGKGLGFFVLIELLAYKCVGLIPMALPLAILISSVMVLGNLAEHYELSSFKSAGVPLLRVMQPIIIFGLFAVVFSYLCSNYLIPIANLNFGSRMYDIQRQKPALRLDAGVFNDDFQGYSILIGEKGKDGKEIKKVMIYDHQDASKGQLSQIVANGGQMYMTDNGSYFIMNLEDGNQYMETSPSSASQRNKSFPFVRTSFKSWTKVFDLGEFDLSQTNKELFKQNRSMMTIGQLKIAIDSIAIKIKEREVNSSNQLANYLSILKLDSTFIKRDLAKDKARNDSLTLAEELKYDSLQRLANAKQKRAEDSIAALKGPKLTAPKPKAKKPVNATPKPKAKTAPVPKKLSASMQEAKRRAVEKTKNKKRSTSASTNPKKAEYQAKAKSENSGLLPSDTTLTFGDAFHKIPLYHRKTILTKAKSSVRAIKSQAESGTRIIDNMRESKVKHIYELYTKYSMAVVCFVFVLIGAPMGAIVRKGGFGYPILVSIIFFMLFVILTIFCRKIAETFVVSAVLSAWIPCLVLFPIGALLTYKAMNDSTVVNVDKYTAFFAKLFKKKDDEKLTPAEPAA